MSKMSTNYMMTKLKNWILGKLGNITALIPSQASSSNKLADKAFVNSSIATATATFRGTYNLVSDLSLTISATQGQIATALASAISTADNNDYAFVQIPTSDSTPTEIARIDKYKYNGVAWAFEYSLNNSGFTAAQWSAINSGITSAKVGKLDDLPTNSELTALLNGKQNVISDLSTIRSGASAGATAVQPASMASTIVDTVAKSGVFDLSVHNAVNGVPATYADLSAALTALNTLPADYKKGGMSIKFVHTSDNKYVQYRYMETATTGSPNPFLDTANWQGVDDGPVAGSDNLVKSGGVFASLFYDEDWDDTLEFKASIGSTRFYYNEGDNCKIFTVSPRDVISIKASANGTYLAILSELPVLGSSTIPYATQHTSRMYYAPNFSNNFEINSSSNAKFLLVESSRLSSGSVVDEKPVVFSINGINVLANRKEQVNKAIKNLKQGIFIPTYNSYVLITANTITIPNGSRIVYDNTYYRINSDVVLNRDTSNQYDIVVFDTSDKSYKIVSNYDFIDSTYLFCFYVRNNGGCSLGTDMIKYDGNFKFLPFKEIDSFPILNSKKLVESGGVVDYVSRVEKWNEIPSRDGAIGGSASGMLYNLGGKYKAIPIEAGNTIKIKASGVIGYAAVVKSIPVYGVSTIPYAIGESRRILQANTSYTITAASDAKFIIIEECRLVNDVLTDETPAYISIDGRLYTGKETELVEKVDVLFTNLSVGTIIPAYTSGKYINITPNNVTIPSNSRLWCHEYYKTTSDITIQRTTGNQSDLVLFNYKTHTFKIIGVSNYSYVEGDYLLFTLSNDTKKICSLPITYYTFNGEVLINKEEDPESIFTYNNKNSAINKLIQLKSVQDGYGQITVSTKSLANESNLITFLHFSDLHADVNNLGRIVEFWNTFKDTYISDIIHTGDAAYSKIDDEQSVPNVFERVVGAERILNVVGNHDAWLTGTSWYEATSKQSYDYLFKGTGETPLIDNWGVTQPTDAAENGLCYYHKDYASKKIRLIVLDCMHNNTDQETWFDGLLADTLDSNNAAYGYHVIIAVHYQSQFGLTAKNTTFNCPSGDVPAVTKSNYPTPDTDVQDVPDITGAYHVERLASRMYQKVNTFITNGGKFICWLCGHTHKDYFGIVPGYNNQLQITIDTAGRIKGDDYNWESRINHTQSCDCFNIIAIDTLHKVIKIVRIGVNRDSRMRLIDTMCYDYQNGTVISNN